MRLYAEWINAGVESRDEKNKVYRIMQNEMSVGLKVKIKSHHYQG